MAAAASANTSKHRRTCTEGQRGPTQQIELFGDEGLGAQIALPAWQSLPAVTQAVLTSLMTRLILDHVEARRAGSVAEASHDL
jgi:hypothetical protein